MKTVFMGSFSYINNHFYVSFNVDVYQMFYYCFNKTKKSVYIYKWSILMHFYSINAGKKKSASKKVIFF